MSFVVGCFLEDFLIQIANHISSNLNFVINELKPKVLSNSTLLLIKIFGVGRFAPIPPHSLSVLLQAFEGSFPTLAQKELHLTCFVLYTFPFQIESYRKQGMVQVPGIFGGHPSLLVFSLCVCNEKYVSFIGM